MVGLPTVVMSFKTSPVADLCILAMKYKCCELLESTDRNGIIGEQWKTLAHVSSHKLSRKLKNCFHVLQTSDGKGVW